MTIEPHTPPSQASSFGQRLQQARENLGWECKEAAAQLRLNEKYVMMMESENYSEDLPPTFIRGYLRAYSKLLKIPEMEIEQALDNIKSNFVAYGALSTIQPLAPLTSNNYFMKFFTYLIILTLFGLVGTWWYTRTTPTTSILVQTQPKIIPVESKPVLASTPVTENNIAPKIETKPVIAPKKPELASAHTITEADADDEDDDTTE